MSDDGRISGFESVLLNAPVATQKFLTVPKALSLRQLSRRSLQILDNSEEFWLAIMNRAGSSELYRSCVNKANDRALFLQLIANETLRWQRFSYSRCREFPITSQNVHIDKVRSTRAARIAAHFDGKYKCQCAVFTGCICDTGARLMIETDLKDPVRIAHVLSKTIELLDKGGRQHRIDGLIKAALPSDLAKCQLMTHALYRSSYVLNDGSLAFIWQDWSVGESFRLGVIVSLHLSIPTEVPYLRHLLVPKDKTISALSGRSCHTHIAVGCSDGTIYVFAPGEVEPVIIKPRDSGGLTPLAVERLEISEAGDLIAMSQQGGLKFKFFEKSSENNIWKVILEGNLIYKDNTYISTIEWELKNPASKKIETRGFTGAVFQPKTTPKRIPCSPALSCQIIGEAVTPLAGGLLCFPIFSLADENIAFPEKSARLFHLTGESSAHGIKLHYFPPAEPYVIQPFLCGPESALLVPDDDDDDSDARLIQEISQSPSSQNSKIRIIYRQIEMPAFMFVYKIGIPRQILRWKGCWIVCIKNIIRIFEVVYKTAGVVPLTILAGHESRIYRFDLDEDLSRLISVEDDEVAIIWDLCKGKKIMSLDLLKFPTDSDEIEEEQPSSDLVMDSVETSTAAAADLSVVEASLRNPSLPLIGQPTYYEDDFPTLGARASPAGSAVWGRAGAKIRQPQEVKPETAVTEHQILEPRLKGAILAENNCPPDIVELSRNLNVSIEQLLADHAQQAFWDSSNDPRTKIGVSKTPISSIARRLCAEFVPEKFWEDKVLNAPNPASRRAASRDKITSSLKHALKQMRVRNGCVSNIWLTHSTLSIYYNSLSLIQTWYFLDDHEMIT